MAETTNRNDAHSPIHPGENLKTEFMAPIGPSANRLAKPLGVPANRVSQIVAGRRDVTADTAPRLAKVFATGARFWLTLQMLHDLEVADAAAGEQIAATVVPVPRPGTAAA